MNLLVMVLFLIVLVAQGCVNQPEIIDRPVFVDVPVTDPCVEVIPKEPRYETTFLKASDDLDTIATAYMVEREQRKIYIKKLRALMAGCIPLVGKE